MKTYKVKNLSIESLFLLIKRFFLKLITLTFYLKFVCNEKTTKIPYKRNKVIDACIEEFRLLTVELYLDTNRCFNQT